MTSIKYDYNFLAMTHSDEGLRANSYSLTLHLIIKTLSAIDQQMAFSRMDFVLNEVVSDCIFVDENDTETIEQFKDLNLKVLTVPDPGSIDQIVHIVIVNKLNAITEDKINIFESEMSSAIGHYVRYMYYTNSEVEDDVLVSKDSKKWWNDKYTRFSSIVDTSKIADFNQTSSWHDLDMHWEADEVNNDNTVITFSPEGSTKQPTNVVTITDFDKEK